MKNLKSLSWIAVISVFLVLVGSQSYGQYGWGRSLGNGHRNETGNGRSGSNIERPFRMEALLDLSEEQSQAVEKIRLGLQKESLPSINKIGEKGAQLKTLISENADVSKINQLIDEIGQLRISLQKQRVNADIQIRKLLSDEQKIKFNSYIGNEFARGGGCFRSFGRHGWDLK